MKRVLNSFCAVLAIGLLVSPLAWGQTAGGDYLPPVLEPQLSSDGNTLYNGVQPLIIVDRPKPLSELRRIPPPPEALVAQPEAAAATFSITYVAAGDTENLWGYTCLTFPEAAKPAFNAAAAVWASLLQSSVPITIRACWANLGSSSILGGSGGGDLLRDFSGAPHANTWYSAALANSLNGSDLAPANWDMHITYNSGFSWYYGTDGATPPGQYDLMSVVMHEIGHGLNFSGTAQYAGGQGSIGISGYPGIYDTFMRDGAGTPLTSYVSPSLALGSVLTGGDLWFHGSNAMAANGTSRVKMYAPGTWSGGSSYSHLDYSTFNNTANQLMVYAFSDGEAVHDPGPITKGLLKDLGWPGAAVSSVTLTPSLSSPRPVGTSIPFTAAAAGGSGSYQYYFTYRTPAGTWVGAQAYSSTPTWTWNTTGLAAGVYTVQVWARNAGSTAALEAYASLSYTLTTSTSPVSSVTLTANPVSPRPVGTSIVFTAAASGGTGSYQYYFTYLTPAGTWVAARAYSSTPTWTWNTTGLATGVYTVQVWARNVGSTASVEAYKSLSYTLTTGPVSSVTLTPNPVSPRPVGTSIIFTAAASGGSGSYQYYFTYLTPAGTWVAARAYSSTPTWTWNTTGQAAGVYTIQVWARNVGSTASVEAYKSLSYTLTTSTAPVSSVTITPNLSSPRPVGTVITFTAAASGGSGSYQYYFTYRNPAGTWTVGQVYSATATWTWNTAGLAAGTYVIQVWARNAGSTASYEAYKSLSYILTLGMTITPSLSSPRPVGTSITFTAEASGGSGSYHYYFTYRTPAGTWIVGQAYSATPTWTWNTAGHATGNYVIQVWARNSGSTVSYEVYKSLSYALN
ncbi:MAG: phage tail protein [Syntrophales bacterium]